MGIAERKDRQRTERERRIVTAARHIAEHDGWEAVTIRRLAQNIEYSQPVLYAHFENRDAIVAAVAVEGFRELTAALRHADHSSIDRRDVPENIGLAYLAFARTHPALYEAMFTLPTRLRFAEAETRPELREAFTALAAASPSSPDIELAIETFWSALHGLAELERSGRIRAAARNERVSLIVHGLLEARQSGGRD